MPLSSDSILSAPIHAEPVATIDTREAEVGDVLLVCEHRRIYWRTILEPASSIFPPSVSPTGWVFLGKDHPKAKDSAWILSGVDSIEPDPGSSTTVTLDAEPSSLDAFVRATYNEFDR